MSANKDKDGNTKSDILSALAADHLNDVISSLAAMVTLAIAQNTISWWIDPAGCIIISLVICQRWFVIMKDQMEKLIGESAPADYIENIKILVMSCDVRIKDVDRIIAYYSGSKYNVEVELILSEDMTVGIAHDIALGVQDKIEDLQDVQRANIHIDFMKREYFEHKIERELAALKV